MTSVDLPPPETPVTQVKRPSGIVAVTFFRLLPRAPTIFSSLPGSRRAAPAGIGDRPLAREIMAGQRIGVGGDLGRRPLGDDLAAMHARARADVDDIIGGPDRVLVVLDHDHRVAEVAQAPQRVEQARVVALVQADRRLVEHIEHARQPRADLRSEPDALALAARQRARRARQRQIVEPDVAQEGRAGRRSPSGCGGRSRCAWRRASRADPAPSRSPP